MGKLELIR